MFSDPAWDILLDLFVARVRSQRIAVSSACIAANVSTTTALRWIIRLDHQGAIVKIPDPADARRSFVEIGPATFEQMARWLRRLRDALVD